MLAPWQLCPILFGSFTWSLVLLFFFISLDIHPNGNYDCVEGKLAGVFHELSYAFSFPLKPFFLMVVLEHAHHVCDDQDSFDMKE